MKFTLSWLKDHLDTDAPVEQLADKLSSMGLEVESIDDPGKKLAPFTIAKVLEAKQHPNADRLRVCQVDTGKGVVEVVCGAPNAKPAWSACSRRSAPTSPAPASRWRRSRCAASSRPACWCRSSELELSDDHEGIIELDDDASPASWASATPTCWASPIRSST